VSRPLHSRPESAARHSGRTASNPRLCCSAFKLPTNALPVDLIT
jgi:hypothetical protein